MIVIYIDIGIGFLKEFIGLCISWKLVKIDKHSQLYPWFYIYDVQKFII